MGSVDHGNLRADGDLRPVPPRLESDLCRPSGRSRFWTLSGIYQMLCNLTKLNVEVLGGPAENVERVVGADALPLHQDSFSLPNQFPGAQRSTKVLDAHAALFIRLGNGDCQSGE